MAITKFFFSVLQRIIRGNLVFFPHIGNTGFPVFLDLFRLGFQTETFFIQKTDLIGQLIPFFKELFMTLCTFFFFLLQLFKLFFGCFFFCGKALDLYTDILNGFSFLCCFLAAFFQGIQDFFFFF